LTFTEKRTLGRSGLSVSRLGLSGGYGVPRESVEKAFFVHNINTFYWGSLRRKGMGEALKSLGRNHRKELVLILQSYDHLGWTVERSVRKGLDALGFDVADILLLGWHNRMPATGVLKGVETLKKEGVVKSVAMSGHNRKFFGKMADQDGSIIDIFMVRYNAAHRGAEEEIFPHLAEKQRPGIMAYTATRWGKLLNPRKMPPGEKPLTAADCYRFAISHPAVDLCMMGPRSAQEFEEGIQALEMGPLTQEEMERARRIGDFIHQGK